MQIESKISAIQNILDKKRSEGSIGFVPTMGALHNGHLSLIKESVKENSYTVASVFVNPTQFNDKSDLDRYPRDLDKDCEMLESAGCDLVFAPDAQEMYPEPDNRSFDFGLLETVMEGKHRPGHFNGVGQVVSKFFDYVKPDKAYFGLKDFQQLAIIKKLVSDFNYPVEIVSCAIIRENDGLAMSSRNMLLEQNKRNEAPIIYKTLIDVVKWSSVHSLSEITQKVVGKFISNPELELEYFEIVDDVSLQSLSELSEGVGVTACIAVHAGKIRLIDNIQIKL